MGQGKKPPMIGSVNLREEDSRVIHRPQGDITAALISGWLSDFCKVCKGFPTIWRNAKDNLSIDTLEPLVDWARGRFDYFLRICKECAEDPQCYLCYTTNVYLRDVPVSQHGR